MERPGTGVVTIELYRHGHSKKNSDSRFVGGRQPGSPLTPKGEAQAYALGQALKERRALSPELFAAAYGSEAVRAIRTGMIALHAAGIEMPVLQKSGLNEMSKGVWEGRLRDEPFVYNHRTLTYPSRQDVTWESSVPGGESYADVAARKTETLIDIAASHEPGEHIAVFGHAIATRCVLAAMYGQDLTWFEMKFPHCTHATFTYSPEAGLQLAGLPPMSYDHFRENRETKLYHA